MSDVFFCEAFIWTGTGEKPGALMSPRGSIAASSHRTRLGLRARRERNKTRCAPGLFIIRGSRLCYSLEVRTQNHEQGTRKTVELVVTMLICGQLVSTIGKCRYVRTTHVRVVGVFRVQSEGNRPFVKLSPLSTEFHVSSSNAHLCIQAAFESP